MSDLHLIQAGVVDYPDAWQWQRTLHAQRVAGEVADTVLLLQHPPVYTAGKRTLPAERPVDGTPVIDVDRGGKITWHGPGQLVGYPIVELADPVDVIAYVRQLERILMKVCGDFGVSTMRVAGRSGVWVAGNGFDQDRKIAAIGVRVAKRVTLHGFSLNCNPDLAWYSRIVPCGIADAGVTSLSAETGRDITVAEVLPAVYARLPQLTSAYSETTAQAAIAAVS